MKLISTIALALLPLSLSQAELTIVSTQHRDADSFKRVSEYLTGKHSDGRYSVFRSDETSRDGFYVSLLAEQPSLLSDVKNVRVQFVRAGSQDIDSFEVPAGEIKKKRLLVGFTGAEWQSGESHPIAWKIELLDASGSSLDSAQSFLWSE